jgi:ethanolamine utilization protein EutN
MQLGRVIGHATSTVKHATLAGWRMVVVQPLDAAGGEDGTPIIAIDNLGSDHGSQVILTSDGKGVRQMIGSDNTPVRWAIIGIKD